MGKRKQNSEGEEDHEHDTSNSDEKPQKAATSKATTSAKASSKVKTVKKPKMGDFGSQQETGVAALKNTEGDKYMDLGKKKRATVRPFKGQVYLDIREYYGSDGDEKPGKKGISLTMEQWEALKRSISTIDSLFAEHGKK